MLPCRRLRVESGTKLVSDGPARQKGAPPAEPADRDLADCSIHQTTTDQPGARRREVVARVGFIARRKAARPPGLAAPSPRAWQGSESQSPSRGRTRDG